MGVARCHSRNVGRFGGFYHRYLLAKWFSSEIDRQGSLKLLTKKNLVIFGKKSMGTFLWHSLAGIATSLLLWPG